ncbi:carboxyl-terminal processing protease [Roseiarcus fermentans]|uniref:Carboxyl-terminal processing protease n=1 Tax=Roseiarcus fermentans TaxID=1473586 RepID=A0A366EVJ3_9HYPH|nr:S41 family peptidase [Roseiarcus fermentans]RBP06413.1 carboxyl-terminal processing protease [Roseiarcus fermentans]
MAATRRQVLSIAACVAAGGLLGWAAPAAAEAGPGGSLAAPDRSAFDQVWELVRDRFYDPRLHGVDWDAMRRRFSPQVAAARSNAELAAAINAMLATLNASHTHFYTPDEPAYYQLADIFAGALEHRGLGKIFPGGAIRYPGIGIFTETDSEGRQFVAGAIDGAPGRSAGLLVGDEILSVDGRPFEPVGSFRGKVGARASMSIRRAAGAAPIEVAVAPVDLEPGALFLAGLRQSARIVPGAGGARVGYVRVWSYASRRYQSALEDLIAEGPLRDADALVWDLRDGWGGAQPWYLDLFNARAPTMQVADRDGETGIVGARWRKPVAALINGGTRSGKEVLAYGFREYRLGPLVGARTEGAVLAATAFLVGDAGLLLLAVEDVLVDGKRLEGVGVEPTIPVPFDRRWAEGRDPQLDRAVEALTRSRVGVEP